MTTTDQLEARIRSLESCIVAFSGGVDSSLVAALAARALGERALAVTAVSPALATGELDGAREVAGAVGIRHETLTTAELEREGYRANDRDRCYHCKSELYDRLSALATRRGYAVVLSGANADDIGDWRPGLRAAAEHGVIHPLLEAGVGKDEVRELARDLGVPSADKPASPCLASRIPYGTAVDPVVLAQIDRAELAVKALGFSVLRVRHHGPSRTRGARRARPRSSHDRRASDDRRGGEHGWLRGGRDRRRAVPLGLAQRIVHQALRRRDLGDARERGLDPGRIGAAVVERAEGVDDRAGVATVTLRRHRQRLVERPAAVRAGHLQLCEETCRLATRKHPQQLDDRR